jgi:uncharacterized protein (DUF1330 family)
MADQKIYMLNALWFKPDGGAEKYREYMKAVAPYLRAVGGKVHSAHYAPQKAIIGEFDADLIFFVEYPNEAAFQSMAQDPGYLADAYPLREAAIAKSLLIQCAGITPAGTA